MSVAVDAFRRKHVQRRFRSRHVTVQSSTPSHPVRSRSRSVQNEQGRVDWFPDACHVPASWVWVCLSTATGLVCIIKSDILCIIKSDICVHNQV
ncbi:uncharacterized protein M421DRAFT_209033 [Didymella exigua CBS 183.55]|uniref:Uncharacterized protein n=1 Tax=Didymella exigua CBS 183.55 TaxID=1150837 RepID=A0A6A5RE11_9PLEO|nr:uncharacterized protein M421DRAFT_209033 [Didymella exigua CBS 183.55]KAF1926521.1 hypothetical protein M421DRAFT_209033 [Didymella exigua CBS 183.55]